MHGDPIMGVDPTGESLLGSISIAAAIGAAIGGFGGAAVGTLNMIAGSFLNSHITACDSNIMAQPIMGAQYGLAGGLYLGTPVGWFNIIVGGVQAIRTRSLDTALATTPSPIGLNGRNILREVKPQILDAANQTGLPAELIGSILMYEMNQYHVGDFLLDGELFWKPEQRSIGIAQLRLDNLDRAFYRYKVNCKTRQKLLNNSDSVYLLADVLDLMTNQLDSAKQSKLSNWDSQSQGVKEWLVRHFTFGKDNWDAQLTWKIGDGDDAWGQIFGVEKGLRVIQDEGLLD